MGQDNEIKIRVLPRTGEKKAPPRVPAPGRPSRWLIGGLSAAVVILSAALLWHIFASSDAGSRRPARNTAGKLDLASIQDPTSARISRLMQESQVKQEMLMRGRQIQNLESRGMNRDADVAVYPDGSSDHIYGLQLDQENTSDRLYRDLDDTPVSNDDMLPDQRINARLEKRKWLNQEERARRIEFVRQFIRSAYDKGYEVEIDQNLVVVGVKPITGTRRLNIDQVINKLAQGGL